MDPQDPKGTDTPRFPLLASLKSMSFRDWLFALHILGRRERALLGLFAVLVLIGGSVVGTGVFLRFTHEAPAGGGVFREGVMRSPELVNPLFLSSNDTDRDLTELIFSKLFSYDAAGGIQPDLAESYAIADDGKSYVVNLRQGITWHDGISFTADDVVFTVKTIQDPAYKSSLRPNWQGVTIERLGDYSVRFILKQPYSPFLQNLALPIIPRHIWERMPVEAAALAEANIKPVGTGPYEFSDFDRDSNGAIGRYAVTANSDYYREGPYIKKIIFRVYPDETAMIQAYKNKEIDGISSVSARNVDYVKALGASIDAIRMPRIFALFLDESHPALKDKSVRQALALAIPKDELIEKVLGGGAIPIESAIPPGAFGHEAAIAKTPFDPEQAKTLLDKAGWKTGENGIRTEKVTTKQGSKNVTGTIPLHITISTSDWKDLSGAAAEIKNYWKAVGVDTEIRTLPIADLEEHVIRPRKYDALLFGEILGHDPDPFAFWHSSQLKDPGLNIALYHSPKVDQLLESARKITDRGEIEAKYKEFQRIVDADFPAIFLYSPTYFYVVRSNVRGVSVEQVVLPSERLESLRLWYLKTRRAF